MVMKYLVLLGVVLAVYLLWRWQRAQEQAERKRPPPPPPPAPPRPAPPSLPQEIVQCATCEVHLPRSEALADARGLHYCSPEHRRQGGS
jgi:uncharacterized protein